MDILDSTSLLIFKKKKLIRCQLEKINVLSHQPLAKNNLVQLHIIRHESMQDFKL